MNADKKNARRRRLLRNLVYMEVGVGQRFIRRMLKNFSSGVLASFRPSTYPSGYASVLHSLRPCWTNFLSILRGRALLYQTCGPLDFGGPALFFCSLLV